MRVAATGRPERVMGDSVIPAEPPRWGEVREHAAELGAAAPHLEILTTLARAGVAVDGLPGLARALAEMADTLEARWSAMFPEPDEDDPDEPWYARTNLFADLAADPDFRDALARTPLIEARGIGAFSARDIDIAAGVVDGDEEERARAKPGLIDGAFAEADPESLGATRDALDGALAACRRVQSLLEREIGPGGARPLEPIGAELAALASRFEQRAGARPSAPGDAANDGTDASGGDGETPAANDPGGTAAVGTPAGDAAATDALADHDAVRDALGAIVRYYARYEPGSPVAVLAARTRALVGRDFFELVSAFCPEGDAGTDLVARVAAPRRDPLATLLAAGFGTWQSGGGSGLEEATAETSGTSDDGGYGGGWAEETTAPAGEAGSVDDDPSASAESGHADSGGEQGDASGEGLPQDDADGTGADATGADDVGADAASAAGTDAGSAIAGTEPAGPDAALASRDDVVRTIDRVLAFYRAREPSSPVPLVLARMRALVPLDFDGVLDALAKALAVDEPAADDGYG